ncbi:hypothetical protein DWV12_14555 [Clostridium botulinum]|uniref:ABC-three component system protein n=1 Tax=Clostridium botulinum TaxID=1491 RepID=UPI00217EAE31|nr:ABC-three component system protein [Clostridium botulinum]MCS6103532.1 hypothetical protein [Clostridium botulinum]MCS6108569.1 hypothetical protein [Clostridium botulinum]
MFFYNEEEIRNEKREINSKKKERVYSGHKIPYEHLGDREFEILIYDLYKRHEIEINKNFENIALMSGVAEHGRDAVLYKNGEPNAIIQCKHTSINSAMGKSQAAKEIIKFVLYVIDDKNLIPSNGEILYYFVNSNVFKEEAQGLLDNFKDEISKQDKLEIWTNQVIQKYEKLKDKKYKDIKIQMQEIFNRLNVKRVERPDIDILISNQNDILSIFFEVKKVIEKNPRLPNKYETLVPTKEELEEIYYGDKFVLKLNEIKIDKKTIVFAIFDYWRVIETLNLISEVEFLDSKIISSYQSDLLRKYNNFYCEHCEKIDNDYEEDKINKLSRSFYREVTNQNPLQLIGIDYNRPFFQNGMYQDIANTKDFVVWKLKKYEDNDNEIKFDDFF